MADVYGSVRSIRDDFAEQTSSFAIDHRTEIEKLTFRALAFRQSAIS